MENNLELIKLNKSNEKYQWIKLKSRTLKKNKIKLLFLICCTFNVLFMDFYIENFSNPNFLQAFRNHLKNVTTSKHILFWPGMWYFSYDEGQTEFYTRKCPVKECYITFNKSLFGGDLSKFHSILFFGVSLEHPINIYHDNLPTKRYQYQKYVYMNAESAHNYPICRDKFNGYFNWTVTYRLDSDSIFQYLAIRDAEGKFIGPRKNIKWIEKVNIDNEKIVPMDKLRSKKRAVAWFASNCETRSHREDYVKELNKALLEYNLTVDIYGRCGNFSCQKFKEECDEILEKDYFFYLAFENSFADDYVTEKVLHGIKNTVIPVVYGGANYSWFLPPGSYIDARIQSPAQLARTMHNLMNNITLYSQYFWWKPYYTFSLGSDVLCDFCELINDDAKFESFSVYDDIRNWWYPNYTNICPNLIESNNLFARMSIN